MYRASAPRKLLTSRDSRRRSHRDRAACRNSVHPDAHLMATDRVGLRVLLDEWGAVIENKGDAFSVEISGPGALRAAGYNFASLETFWRDHDFREMGPTARKCAIMQNRSLSAPPRNITDPSIEGYFNEGGHACDGCYWGTSHSPFEVMFIHHYISNRFTRGDVAVYSQMDAELRQVATAYPAVRGRGHGAGQLPHPAEKVAAWLERSSHGHCGTTDEMNATYVNYLCDHGDSGSFGLDEAHAHDWKSSSALCLHFCSRCTRCRYITVSPFYRDCSWYRQCPELVNPPAGVGRKFRSGPAAVPPAPRKFLGG